MAKKKPNRLSKEKSLYLRQHMYNPIDWFPWSEEAFEIALKENKPIFLSIGYSSCHWCHVMEKESFEDPEIAKILNENFISIKVDREEHPDVDNFYMTFVQSTTESGGWPLSVFLFPDKTPFFGGTYFPPQPKFGKPSFKIVLLSIIEAFRSKRNEFEKIKNGVKKYLGMSFTASEYSESIELDKIHEAYTIISNIYDWENGGWGKEAKFPMFPLINFLIDYHLAFNNENAIRMVEHKLNRILTGGIYDHISGGMHRYTVDNKWIVPHFEKMLYDNAQLIEVISRFLLVKDNEFFQSKLYETFNFLKSEMKFRNGGYITAIDADSEGEEGKFYLWNYYELVDSVEEIIDKELFFTYFQFNLIDSNKLVGNISLMNITDPNQSILLNELEITRNHLNQIRNRRVKPGKDNKILTDLNCRLASALTHAFRATEDENFLKEAVSINDFVLKNLIREGKLYHTFVEGDARISGFAEDYFALIDACINLYEVTFEEEYLFLANDFLKKALELFYDQERNIIYQQESNTSLPLRTSETKDYSKPSSTSLAISNMVKLSKIFENAELNTIAERLIKKNFNEMVQYPFGGGKFFAATLQYLLPSRELILVEGDDFKNLKEFKTFLFNQIYPSQIILFKKKASRLSAEYLVSKDSIENKPTLYICENFVCKKPIVDIKELG